MIMYPFQEPMIYDYPEPHEPTAVATCDICGGDIYEEMDYYIIEKKAICEHCIDEFIQDHKTTSYR